MYKIRRPRKFQSRYSYKRYSYKKERVQFFFIILRFEENDDQHTIARSLD